MLSQKHAQIGFISFGLSGKVPFHVYTETETKQIALFRFWHAFHICSNWIRGQNLRKCMYNLAQTL